MELNPTFAGMDEARLERITEHLHRRYLEPEKIAGCHALVARHGHLAYSRTLGVMDAGGDRAVRDDTIWRIYSMTKPITSVALMSLYERGHFKLTDPVERFLPEWRGQRVAEVADDGSLRLVDPVRPPQVRDLLTHTAGLSYGWDPTHPVDKLYAEAGLHADGVDLEGFAKLLGDLPLKFHPGSAWHYSVATDVCGRLVEVFSGEPLDQFLQSEVFDPLGMVDTGFTVPDSAIDRFASNHVRHPDKTLEVNDSPETSTYRKARSFLSGGGGLVSTTGDYLRFCEMLRRGGELDGHRVLAPRTIEYMTRNHLEGGVTMAEIAVGTLGDVGYEGVGFGLGFATTIDTVVAGSIGSVGDYYWGGAASTLFWIDPVEDLVVIFMVQLMPSGTFDFRGQLKAIVYPAIID